MKIDILDIGSGNIRSIKNWLDNANVSSSVVTQVKNKNTDLLILPGVGSAGPYMKRLANGGNDLAIIEHVERGGRLLGICLGFQIMSEYSAEDGGVMGLGLLKGRVEKLPNSISHNGWEKFKLDKSSMNGQSFNSCQKLSRKRILDGRVFYNHEYGYKNLDEQAYSIPVSEKLSDYTGFFIKDKIIGIQFHPEKSQISGSQLISMIL